MHIWHLKLSKWVAFTNTFQHWTVQQMSRCRCSISSQENWQVAPTFPFSFFWMIHTRVLHLNEKYAYSNHAMFAFFGKAITENIRKFPFQKRWLLECLATRVFGSTCSFQIFLLHSLIFVCSSVFQTHTFDLRWECFSNHIFHLPISVNKWKSHVQKSELLV